MLYVDFKNYNGYISGYYHMTYVLFLIENNLI